MVPDPVVPNLVAWWYTAAEAVGANGGLWGRCLGVQGSRPGSGPQLWPALQAFGARGDTESPRYTSLSGESPSPPRLSCLGEKAAAPAVSVALGASTPLGAQALGVPFSLRQLGESRGAEGGKRHWQLAKQRPFSGTGGISRVGWRTWLACPNESVHVSCGGGRLPRLLLPACGFGGRGQPDGLCS